MPETKAVPPLDAGWLWLESASNLMHGSFLALFAPPPDGGADFVARLAAEMRMHRTPSPPFDRRLKPGWSSRLMPRWEIVDEIDPDVHLRCVRLPRPGGERELGELVSELHGTRIDHAHPPWRIDLIDGLVGDRFAIVGRMHHAVVDGVGALAIVRDWLSEDPEARETGPIWSYRRRGSTAIRSNGRSAEGSSADGERGRSLKGLFGAAVRVGRNAALGVSGRPWSAPRSPLNTPITARRRVSTASFELARFRAVADAAGGTINDVVLAVCAGSLRRYLSEMDRLPRGSLTTNIPVSVRGGADADGSGNRISWAMLAMATDIEDPVERLDRIRAATSAAKRRLSQMHGREVDVYTLLAVTPILLEQLTRVGGRVPPLFNVPVSNVPGPPRTLYLNGARLDEIQAFTVIYSGYGLNVVTLSYASRLAFAFTACADTVPHSQRLAVHCGDALEELEASLAVADHAGG